MDLPVIVGVSGGPDSLCLLHALWRLGYPVVAAHFDHLLRDDSAQDALAVQSTAKALAVPIHLGRADVRGYALENKLSIETAARTLRYRFLYRTARAVGSQAVAVGHNAGDQAETVLFHLLRGTGLNGLAGMRYRAILPEWDETIPLVRPLLGVEREEIDAYCQEQGLEPRLDATNADLSYARNRVRHELLPLLESYNPQIRQALGRLAEAAAGELEVVEEVVIAAWNKCFMHHDSAQIQLDRARFIDLSDAVRRGVLRKAVRCLLPSGETVDYAAVQRADQFLKKHKPGQVDLVGGVSLIVEGQAISIVTQESRLDLFYPQLLNAEEQALSIPGKIDLPGGWRLEAAFASPDDKPDFTKPSSPWQVWLDADSISEPLILRAPKPGDRFQPLGMDGHSIKLSDLMTNAKIPRRARARWPLVTDGEAVVWVPGLRTSHPHRVTEKSSRMVVLTMRQELLTP